MAITIRLRRGTSVQWAAANPILEAGEQGFETDTKKYKVGNGHTHWLDLEGYLPETSMREAIQEAVSEVLMDTGPIAEAILIHVNASEPHPVYDDGPSLFLLYENAKV